VNVLYILVYCGVAYTVKPTLGLVVRAVLLVVGSLGWSDQDLKSWYLQLSCLPFIFKGMKFACCVLGQGT